MARKFHFGAFDMPREIEAAARAFYDAVRDCGYNSGCVDVCPDLDSLSVRISAFHDEGVDATITEYVDGTWQLVGWVDEDDD